jgi:hypothetical protein
MPDSDEIFHQNIWQNSENNSVFINQPKRLPEIGCKHLSDTNALT